MQSFHTQRQLHILRTQPQLSTQTMNPMKRKNVVPFTPDFNEYAEATLDILGEEASMTPNKLLYIYTALKAFVVPLRSSCRFISYNFLLVKSNELLLLYRARSSTCPILSDHSHSYVMLVLRNFQCIYYRSSFPPF